MAMEAKLFRCKDERESLFNPILSRSQLFIPIPIPAPMFSVVLLPVPSLIAIPSRCQSMSHLITPVAIFMDIMKQMTSKLTRIEVFWYQKQLKIK